MGKPWAIAKQNLERLSATQTLEMAKNIEKDKIEAGTHMFKTILDAAGRKARIFVKVNQS